MDTPLEALIPPLENTSREQLQATLQQAEDLASKIRALLQPSPPDSSPPDSSHSSHPPSTPDELFEYLDSPKISKELLKSVEVHLKSLKYTQKKAKFSPETFLYGASKYVYDSSSATVMPTPIREEPIMARLLDAVNTELGTSFNSMLVSRYPNKNFMLGYHKDDEKCLDATAPVATLSFRRSRDLLISETKKKVYRKQTLVPGSIFLMKPGFQNELWHSLASGDGTKDQSGTRFSVTFRRVIPPPTPPPVASSPSTTSSHPPSPPRPTNPSAGAPDTFVFGSSMLHGLNEAQLSKYDKSFKVFSRPGAHLTDISKDIDGVKQKGINTNAVTTVFLLVGGNNIQNLKCDRHMKFIKEDVLDLISVAKDVFPLASINIFSCIPRKATYSTHIKNMHIFNDLLKYICEKERVRFVDIFSFFVNKVGAHWWLNTELFNRDTIHFNVKGMSVLAKVLIAVANHPRF